MNQTICITSPNVDHYTICIPASRKDPSRWFRKSIQKPAASWASAWQMLNSAGLDWQRILGSASSLLCKLLIKLQHVWSYGTGSNETRANIFWVGLFNSQVCSGPLCSGELEQANALIMWTERSEGSYCEHQKLVSDRLVPTMRKIACRDRLI
jgi:hypothetical protein